MKRVIKRFIASAGAAVKSFVDDENGLAAMEYGILAALVTLIIVGGVTTMGSDLKTVIEAAAGQLTAIVTTMSAS